MGLWPSSTVRSGRCSLGALGVRGGRGLAGASGRPFPEYVNCSGDSLASCSWSARPCWQQRLSRSARPSIPVPR
eukprot:7819950-Alexandrium_andersonii.AAC.1